MSGRYYRKADKQKIAEAFHVSKIDDFPLPPWDYNVAPTSIQSVIRGRDSGERELVSLRGAWCHSSRRISRPSKASPPSMLALRRSPSRAPFKKRRCLVPASRFYEWRRVGGKMAPKKDQEKIPSAFDLALTPEEIKRMLADLGRSRGHRRIRTAERRAFPLLHRDRY
jgi:putative SOS response-associated peptidase YedK